jgi:uncharacterized protein with FMN-binding domain
MQRKKKSGRLLALSLCLLLVVSMLGGCTQQAVKPYKAGTYAVEADGNGGELKLEVSFSDTKIEDIKIISQGETAGLGDTALQTMREKILSGQTLAVDAVAGATNSSKAMLTAVEEAVKQAGGNPETLKKADSQKNKQVKTEKLQSDIVVVGAGASGVSAAVSAADQGAKVIIIEKTGIIGGASNLSWAGKFYNSSAALEKGLKVDVEQEIAGWIANNHWRVDGAAIRQYVTKSGDTYDWLASKGYPTTFINFAGEPLHMLPAYDTREGALRKMLADSVEKNGGQVITQTTAKKLMTNEAGEVIGVTAEKSDGTILQISAKSVIMATGG